MALNHHQIYESMQYPNYKVNVFLYEEQTFQMAP